MAKQDILQLIDKNQMNDYEEAKKSVFIEIKLNQHGLKGLVPVNKQTNGNNKLIKV